MQLEIVVKENDMYKRLYLVPPSGADWAFFKSLRTTIEDQLNIIRDDILRFLGTTKEESNLICPKIEDKKKQEKIDTLVQFRILNTKAKETITELLSENEFIICENCGSKMIRTPVDVPYEKVGQTFILKDVQLKQPVRYVFMCENCIFAVSEDIHYQKQHLKQLRQQLIDEGESFLPNEFGFWNWENDKKHTKPAMFGKDEPIIPKRRVTEIIKIGQKEFVKIVDKYADGQEVPIK